MAGYNFSRDPKVVPTLETKYRKISTQIPAPGTKEIITRLEKTESRSMQGQFPIIWDKAEDFSVFDIAGNKFIDFAGLPNSNILDLREYQLLLQLGF